MVEIARIITFPTLIGMIWIGGENIKTNGYKETMTVMGEIYIPSISKTQT